MTLQRQDTGVADLVVCGLPVELHDAFSHLLWSSARGRYPILNWSGADGKITSRQRARVTRLIQTQLFAAVTALAGYIPARRAMGMDPMSAWQLASHGRSPKGDVSATAAYRRFPTYFILNESSNFAEIFVVLPG
jgi:hypothetical protein